MGNDARIFMQIHFQDTQMQVGDNKNINMFKFKQLKSLTTTDLLYGRYFNVKRLEQQLRQQAIKNKNWVL